MSFLWAFELHFLCPSSSRSSPLCMLKQTEAEFYRWDDGVKERITVKDSGRFFLLFVHLIAYAHCFQLRTHQRSEANFTNVRCHPKDKKKVWSHTHTTGVPVSSHQPELETEHTAFLIPVLQTVKQTLDSCAWAFLNKRDSYWSLSPRIKTWSYFLLCLVSQ